MYIKDSIIDQAQDAIISARDFCGDEREAVQEVLADHGIKDKADRNKVWGIAIVRANKEWNGHRAAAGVKRISRPQDWRAV